MVVTASDLLFEQFEFLVAPYKRVTFVRAHTLIRVECISPILPPRTRLWLVLHAVIHKGYLNPI